MGHPRKVMSNSVPSLEINNGTAKKTGGKYCFLAQRLFSVYNLDIRSSTIIRPYIWKRAREREEMMIPPIPTCMHFVGKPKVQTR